MNILEKDIENYIFYTDNGTLMNNGLGIGGRKLRQVSLAPYGVPDIITINKYRNGDYGIQIMEIKRGKIDSKAFMQIIRYAFGVRMWFMEHRPGHHPTITLTLIGDSVSEIEYVPYWFDDIELYTYRIRNNEILFKTYWIGPHRCNMKSKR